MRSSSDVPIGKDPRAARKLHQKPFISKVSGCVLLSLPVLFEFIKCQCRLKQLAFDIL